MQSVCIESLYCVLDRPSGRTVSASDNICEGSAVRSGKHDRVHGEQSIAAHSSPNPWHGLFRTERELPGT